MKLFEAAKTVELKAAYEKYVGKAKTGLFKKQVKCPFHDDHTPSMSFFTDEKGVQRFKCHACGATGTVVDFVMKVMNVTPKEAAEAICRDFGVEYEEDAPMRQEPEQRPQRSSEEMTKEANWILAVNEQLAKIFSLYLQTAPNPKYFEERGVGRLTRAFQLGYCPNKPIFNKNIEKAQALGFCDANGVSVFHDRYIIPIVSFTGRVIGFIGRATPEYEKAHPEEGKYKITSNNILFQKRKILFNPNGLRTEDRNVFVVEGAFDALALIASGAENVVCSLGNSMSDQQLEIFKRSGKGLICAYDDDEAGRTARDKLFRYAKGVKAYAPLGDMKGCKDYSELLSKRGEEAVAKAVSEIAEAPDFLLKRMEEEGRFATDEGQDEAWEALARVIGSDFPEFREKYPLNTGYTPVAFKRYWDAFAKLVAEGK